MEAGELRHRLSLQEPIEVQNPQTGAINVTWAEVNKIWGKITPFSVKDFNASQSEQSKVIARIKIRYRDNINPKMRIHHIAKDMYYHIEGILSDDETGYDYLTLPVSEGVRSNPEATV